MIMADHDSLDSCFSERGRADIGCGLYQWPILESHLE